MAPVLRKIRAAAAVQSERLRYILFGTPDWVKHKRRVDREFDRRFKTNTGGFVDLRSLTLNATTTWRNSMRHVAADPDEFDAAIAALPVSPEGRIFIDFGSGKGRAILLASRHPFAKVIGVEFAEELATLARQNIASFPTAEQKCTDVESVYGDVLTYDLPISDTVLFLYNPFNETIMEPVVQRVLASLREHPRQFHVVYINPFSIEPWFRAGFKEIANGNNLSILIPPG